ncbi:hypothetical protein WS90_37290 [Burkholderia cepacia]|uniref:Uncharacterized protein n=1 Tax=Burkholderia cepacia TaxID=292 RepID=A0A124SR19_BURCE|nr:hypothetical protein WS90_37290 [Burkholderia cepacia]
MGEITCDSDYRRALVTMKQRIQISRSRVVPAINAELLNQPMVEEVESEFVQGNGGLRSND